MTSSQPTERIVAPGGIEYLLRLPVERARGQVARPQPRPADTVAGLSRLPRLVCQAGDGRPGGLRLRLGSRTRDSLPRGPGERVMCQLPLRRSALGFRPLWMATLPLEELLPLLKLRERH